jgi:hypothetical protein
VQWCSVQVCVQCKNTTVRVDVCVQSITDIQTDAVSLLLESEILVNDTAASTLQ